MRTYKVFTKQGYHYIGEITIPTTETKKYMRDYILKGV